MQRCLTDSRVTKNWEVANYNATHRRDLDRLNARVAEQETNADRDENMISSHWSPSMDARVPNQPHPYGQLDRQCLFDGLVWGEVLQEYKGKGVGVGAYALQLRLPSGTRGG